MLSCGRTGGQDTDVAVLLCGLLAQEPVLRYSLVQRADEGFVVLMQLANGFVRFRHPRHGVP